jgi:hypothetical protein
MAIREWLPIQEPGFYQDGIFELVTRWEKLHQCARELC